MNKAEEKRNIRRKAILEKVKKRSERKENEALIEDYYIEELRDELIRDRISISRSTLVRDLENMDDSIITYKMGPLNRVHYK